MSSRGNRHKVKKKDVNGRNRCEQKLKFRVCYIHCAIVKALSGAKSSCFRGAVEGGGGGPSVPSDPLSKSSRSSLKLWGESREESLLSDSLILISAVTTSKSVCSLERCLLQFASMMCLRRK